MLQSNQLIGFGGHDSGYPDFDSTNAYARYIADTGVTGDPVTQWNDQIGSLHLTPGSTAPDYQATGGPNGGPAIYFDGSDDYLENTSYSLAQTNHIFIVMKNVSSASGKMIVGHYVTTSDTYIATYPPALRHAADVAEGNSATAPSDGTWFLLEALFSGASSTLRVAGTTASGTNIGPDGWSDLVLGKNWAGPSPANFAIAEFVSHTAEISGAQLTNNRAYFAGKYGVTT